MLFLTACHGNEETSVDVEEITDIDHTPVKDQSIGNCWTYAVVGWAESLHLTETGETLNLSESYVSYWYWYEQVAGAPAGLAPLSYLDGDKISTGGWFGIAAEIMRRYGVMEEGGFIPEESDEARSARQASALSAINASLASGTLSSTSARADRELVRVELDRVWQLSTDVSTVLNQVFAPDASRVIDTNNIPEGSGLQDPSTIAVGKQFDANGLVTGPITLADAIGEPASYWDLSSRTGEFAWNDINYPYDAAGRRDALRRAQRALHKRLPVLIAWFVDFNAFDSDDGTFRAPPSEPGYQGGHMTTLEDYQINNVPGHGTLSAGQLVTDLAALSASLAEEATVEFLRVKNSWGVDFGPPGGSDLSGYHDLYLDYLNAELDYCTGEDPDPCTSTSPTPGLWMIALPPDSFSSGGGGPIGTCHDPCAEGEAMMSACGTCIDSICTADPYCCTTAWDAICQGEVQSVCNLTCTAVDECQSLCETGPAQPTVCADCVSTICEADAFCCETQWDSLCVSQASSTCNLGC